MTDSPRSRQSESVQSAQAVAAGLSESDFRALYQAEFAFVFRALRRFGVRPSDLEDVAHDLFVAVYRARAEFDRRRAVRPWLYGFAFRFASDYRRRAHVRREVQETERPVVDDALPTDEKMAAAENARLVHAALDTLNLERRAVLVLHDLEGLSMPEIAETLSAPLNTLYSRLRLGREQFAEAVRKLRLRSANREASR